MTGQNNNNKDPDNVVFAIFLSRSISTMSGECGAIEYSSLHLYTIDVNNLEYSMWCDEF